MTGKQSGEYSGQHSGEVLILANPSSGRRDNRARVAALVAALENAGMGANVGWELAERVAILGDVNALDRYAAVVAAGGDGTVAAVVNELHRDASTPLAAFPLGGENLFAREMGFNGDVTQLAQVIARGRVRRIDLGRAGGRWFTLMVSAGLDAAVIHRLAAWRSAGEGKLRRISRFKYLRPLVSAWCGYRYDPIEVRAGEDCVRGALVMVFNSGIYGPQWRLAPQARMDDGLLDYLVLEHPGRATALKYILAATRGRLDKAAGVHRGRAAEIELSAVGKSDGPAEGQRGADTSVFGPGLTQADGDVLGQLPVTIRAVRGALAVVDTRQEAE